MKFEDIKSNCSYCKLKTNIIKMQQIEHFKRILAYKQENRPVCVNNAQDSLLYYSNLYFKFNKSLNNTSVYINNIIVNTNCLIVNNSFNSDHFVPFYFRLSTNFNNKICQGLLLDVPIYNKLNLLLPKLKTNYLSYNNYVPIFINPIQDENYKEKCIYSLYNRISFVNNNINRKIIHQENLDEISPVEEDEQRPFIIINDPKLEQNVIKDKHILLLNPLLLEIKPRRHKQHYISVSEHKKIVQITISYTLAFLHLL